MPVEYFNLTNGQACLDQLGEPGFAWIPREEPARFSRIQSTWCEQKLWNQVLLTTPADMYYQLATGERVIVHDKSERRRLTRAQWQGLAMIRTACNMAWFGTTSPQYARNGMAVTPYFIEQWVGLPETTQRYVAWFRKYVDEFDAFANLVACDCWIPIDQHPEVWL